MGSITKEQARRIVINCAQSYDAALRDKQFLILYRDRGMPAIQFIEAVFLRRNYQHLTGLNLIDRDGRPLKNQSENFYRKCLEKKLGISEIEFKSDGTTPLKLEALPAVTKFTAITKIAGDTNGRQPFLYVEKLVGGVNFCLGLRKDPAILQYVPVSALQRNIKELTDSPSQVLAIFERAYGDVSCYQTIRHVAKGLNLNHIAMPDGIRSKISLENYLPRK